MIAKSMRTGLLLIALVTTALSAIAQDGKAIMQKVYDRPSGESSSSEVELELVNKRGRKRVRRLKSRSMDIGKDRKMIMVFLAPSDVRGTGFLTWDYDDPSKSDDKWLYLPAMRKTRRISSASSKKDYFMGTDFTYDDMGKRNVAEDTHKYLRDETVGGKDCWVVESTPKEKGYIYKRREVWIDKQSLLPVQIRFYDRRNALHREMKAGKISKIDGIWTYESETMTNVQTKHKTILRFKNQVFGQPMEEADFTVVQLEKGI